MKILFATSEMYPLIKTGGLADVSFSLPAALMGRGHDVRVILPFYRQIRSELCHVKCLFEGDVFGFCGKFKVYEMSLSLQKNLRVLLIDVPEFFNRDGSPYIDENGEDWSDNAYRFATFSRVVARVGLNQVGLNWTPDVVHCNDWQTGLVIPLLKLDKKAPATLFSIHNIAYQGIFSNQVFEQLVLPDRWWAIDGIEYYGQCSLIKAGINYTDIITTVSPTYAKEIQTEANGEGLDGLMRYRKSRLIGILNGIDTEKWNPETDSFIAQRYSVGNLLPKRENKRVLQKKLNLNVDSSTPLYGMICRLVYQKGIDLLIDLLPCILRYPLQVVILGSGDHYYEAALTKLAQKFPRKINISIGYDDQLAHQIESGADFFLMPSRYEPCGLNQMYSQRYGTIPIVRNTGGLADTVRDYQDPPRSGTEGKNNAKATGFTFQDASVLDFKNAVLRALRVYQDKDVIQQLQVQGMKQDFSWQKSSQLYEQQYHRAIMNASQYRH